MAMLINGKEEARKLLDQIKTEIDEIQRCPETANFKPRHAVIQIGDRSDSSRLIQNEQKAAKEVGIDFDHIKLPKSVNEAEIRKKVKELNANNSIDGIVVFLPLDATHTVDIDSLMDEIDPGKDVDGLPRQSVAQLARGELNGTIIPCMAKSCLHLVQSTGMEIKGKHVVVVGRCQLVSRPAAALFLSHDATITVCHSKTENLKKHCQEADILIVAVNQPKMIKGDSIKQGAIVVDCGLNMIESEGEKRFVGDVDGESVRMVAGYLTPVPGGVGPVALAMLLRNTFDQAKKRRLLPKTMGGGKSDVD